LLLILAGWINHREQDVIDYLRAENRVLREKLGKTRILLNDDQRRRLAVKGKILGLKMLTQVGNWSDTGFLRGTPFHSRAI
jgi:putative transposase